jgi:Cu+-exporting ATPase
MKNEKIMEKINWKIEGMTCANCALTISNYLRKEGQNNVQTNPVSGEVMFDHSESTTST